MTAAGAQQYLPPHCGLVQPFALTSLAAVRSDPPHYPHGGYVKKPNQILHFSARLDDSSNQASASRRVWPRAARLTGPEPEAGHLSASAQVATRRAVSAPRSDNGVARSHATIWTARCRHKTRQRSVTLAG
jgi:hypothetical protein